MKYLNSILFCFTVVICICFPSFCFSAEEATTVSQINAVEQKVSVEKLYNEGFYFSGRRARLIAHPDGTRWFLVFTKEVSDTLPEVSANNVAVNPDVIMQNPDVSVIQVLPSRWLETMLRVISNKSDYSIIFRIWGEATAYQNRNFIMLSMVATESLFNEAAISKMEETQSSPFYYNEPEVNEEPDPEDVGVVPQYVREKLMKIPRVKVMPFPFKMKSLDGESVTINDTQSNFAQYENDTIISNRVGRLVPTQSEGRVYFMFETGDANLEPKPLIIQPGQYLELMENAVRANNHSVKYIISGRIDEFKGEFYLLPTMVLEEEYRGL